MSLSLRGMSMNANADYLERPLQVPFKRSQVGFLSKAFEENRLPDLAARKEMAMRTGIEESRAQTWFEKQRTLHPVHREEPLNLSDDTNGRPPPAAQWQYVNLVTPQVSCPPFSNPGYHDHPSLPAPLRSQAFVPWDSFGDFGRQVPSTVTMQVPEAVQRRQTPDAPPTYTDHSLEQPIAGQGFSDTPPPFYSPDAEHEKGHSGDPDYIDHIPSIMEWWEKGRLDLIARWDPLKKT